MQNEERVKNLLDNIDYFLCGIEDGWIDCKEWDSKLISVCYMIQAFSKNTYDEIFKFKDKGVPIRLK